MTPEFVVVGSGPAGISAAWPLVQAGRHVLMIDAGDGAPRPAPPAGAIGSFRRSPDRWRARFGADLAGLALGSDTSPKLAAPLARATLADYAAHLGLETDNFHALGTLDAGGLSAIWGAMAPRFDEADLAAYPITLADLAPSYDAVEARIGISRPGQDGAPLTRAAARIAARAARARPELTVEPATNAVLATPGDARQPCANCGLCLWGCARRSIYAAADELPAFRRHPNFQYRTGTFVRAIERAATGYTLRTDSGEIHAPTLILAAGTIATTALVARHLGRLETPIRLQNNPVAACAFLIPTLIGAALPDHSFSLAQLRHEQPLSGGGTAGGALYGADTLPFTEIARRLPLSRPAALRVSRALAPALVLATLYLPGRYSDNTITVTENRLSITGRLPEATRTTLTTAARTLARALRRTGAHLLPGSLTLSPPGADAHYAATLPMGADCTDGGELRAAPNLYIADGTALSDLPSKHCTLTIMAHADRLARRLLSLREVGR